MEQAQDIKKIVGPEDAADSFSHGGETFKANKDGEFEVPGHVAAEMHHHGFKVVPAKPANQKQAGK
jgi:hypothetical protein